jgi:hypothetical protein
MALAAQITWFGLAVMFGIAGFTPPYKFENTIRVTLCLWTGCLGIWSLHITL